MDTVKTIRTKGEEIQYINELQDAYVEELIKHIEDNDNSIFKETNLTSPTGTGKTVMMAKLINKRPDWFFLVTTLSHGQLHKQVKASIDQCCHGGNYNVYGVSSFKKGTKLQANDIISSLPENKPIIWLRDEGHRKTNNWMQLLEDKCHKIVNISATNESDLGVTCNFADTMMLRTVQQQQGEIEDAIEVFLNVKKVHSNVPNYTPCILFRVTQKQTAEKIIKLCIDKNIRCISLVGYDDYDMSELCEDDCEIEAIIYMQKMDVGIDIRRAHVIWIQSSPNNIATTIQCVGRCRRNALFWRDDIDIMAPENGELLRETRICHAVYKISEAQVDTNEFGEMAMAFCPYISVQKLRPNSKVTVNDGMLANGLIIIELQGCTGEFEITIDCKTGFNIVNNDIFYKEQTTKINYHLENERLDMLFNPSEALLAAIKEMTEKIKAFPHLNDSFYFGRLNNSDYFGLYMIKECFYFNSYIDETGKEGYLHWDRNYQEEATIYESADSLIAEISRNYIVNKDSAEIAKLKRMLSLAKIYNKEIDWIDFCTNNRWNSYISCSLPQKKEIRLKDKVLLLYSYYYHEYFAYTYGECMKVLQHGTIDPKKERYYIIIFPPIAQISALTV